MRGSPELLTRLCRRIMLESASPIALPTVPTWSLHAKFQTGRGRQGLLRLSPIRMNSGYLAFSRANVIRSTQASHRA
jgi:hypothetical protein